MIKRLRRTWPLGVRLQLTLWFSLVFSVLVLLFGGVFYVQLSNSLVNSFDASLRGQTQQISKGIDDDKGVISVYDVTGELPGISATDKDDAPVLNATPPARGNVYNSGGRPASHGSAQGDSTLGTLVRVVDIRGKLLYTTPGFSLLRLPNASLSDPLHGRAWVGTVLARNGQMVRVYCEDLVEQGKVYAVLQVGELLAPLQATQKSVVIELMLIAPFILLLGALGSYVLASRAFMPIDTLTSTARSIGDGELHRRVPEPGANDEIQRLAWTFNEMLARLEQAFTRQRRFVADASHELRTPVAAIRSITDVALAQGATPEEYRAILQEVNAEAERLGLLINDLLVLARADEGRVAFEREPVRLDLLVSDVAATIEPLALEAGMTLEVQRTAEPVTVLGDEARLIQVIMNLLDNAIAYTDAGGQITLGIERKTLDRKRYACLTVCDTGIGIEAKHLTHIFERFYRADPTRTSSSKGVGLGLAIVEWVIQAHGGTVSVVSQPGRGSMFTVMLPLVEQGM